MSDEALAPSNGANETSVVETQTTQAAQDSGAQQTQQQTPSEPAKPVSTSEAIDRAFEKTDLFSENKEAKAAKPASDNRDPKTGQFTEKPKDGKAAKPAAEVKIDPQQKPAVDAQQQTQVQVRPAPSRLSKEAQAVWAQVPEVARNEIERAFTELQGGIEKYKTAYEPIKQFDEMAHQSGTTLQAALNSYVGIEQLLRRDVLAGIREVCKNVGVDPQKVAEAIVAQGGQQQQQQGGDTVEVQQLKQQLNSALQEINGLKQQFTGFSQTAEDRALRSEIDEFKKDKPYFEQLAPVMQQLLAGTHPEYAAKNLASAYDMAVRLTPEIAAKIEAEKAAAVQTAQNGAAPQPKPAEAAQTGAKAKLSITGSPSSGSNPAQRKPAGSPRAALDKAFESVGL